MDSRVNRNGCNIFPEVEKSRKQNVAPGQNCQYRVQHSEPPAHKTQADVTRGERGGGDGDGFDVVGDVVVTTLVELFTF